jgi:hypothetical protein
MSAVQQPGLPNSLDDVTIHKQTVVAAKFKNHKKIKLHYQNGDIGFLESSRNSTQRNSLINNKDTY